MMQTRICKTCGSVFDGGPRAWYCVPCRTLRARDRNVRYKKTGPRRAIGSTDQCERCHNTYVVTGGLQRFCPDCKPIHNAEYDRNRAMPKYEANKERLNPIRYARRRREPAKKICPYCGIPFTTMTRAQMCGADRCRKLRQKMYDDRRRKLKSERCIAPL